MKTAAFDSTSCARAIHDLGEVAENSHGLVAKSIVLECGRADSGEPQAFLIEQAPRSFLSPHFHLEDQFQVIVAGSGRLGRHEVQPYTVHYAAGSTGYGPIVAGPEGLSYVSIRAVATDRTFYLPQAKGKKNKGKRVSITSECIGLDALEPVSKPEIRTLIEPRTDGVAAWLLRMPPNGSCDAPRSAAGGQQARFVLGGSMKGPGTELPRLSCAFLAPGEASEPIGGGAAGLDLLVLQFSDGRDKAA